jgi:MFS family permease
MTSLEPDLRPPGTEPNAARRSVLRDRNFLRFWTGEMVSMLGNSITGFAIAIVAVEMLHATPGQMGLLRALDMLPAIVVGLFVGVWVDRVRRRRLLVVLDLCAAGALASVPVAYLFWKLTIEHLYVLGFTFGVLGTFWWPAWNAFLPAVVSRDRLVDANSKLSLSMSATGMVGPGIAGVLVDLLSAPVALIADAISFLVSAVAIGGVRTRERPAVDQEDDASPIRERIGEGLRVAFLDPMQRALTAPMVILEFVDALSLAVYAIFTLRTVDLRPAALGIVFTTAGLGFLLGSTVAPRLERRMRPGRAALLGLALVGVSPFTMVLADADHPLVLNLVFLGLPGIIGGFGGVIQWVMLSSLRQAITPERVLGRVYASVGVLSGALAIVGALLGGYLAAEGRLGPRGTILVAAIGYTIPFFSSLFSPLRDATTSGSDGRHEGSVGEPETTMP